MASTLRKSFQGNKIPEIEKNSGSAKRTSLSKNRDLSCGWREIEKRIKIVGEAKVYI